jgi:hypothetical protein
VSIFFLLHIIIHSHGLVRDASARIHQQLAAVIYQFRWLNCGQSRVVYTYVLGLHHAKKELEHGSPASI